MNRIEVTNGERYVDAQLSRARTAITHLGQLHRMGKLTDVEDRKAVEQVWQHYDTYHHMGPEHSHLAGDEFVERFALAGTPEEVKQQVENLLRYDIGELTTIPFGQSKEFVLETFAKAAIGKL